MFKKWLSLIYKLLFTSHESSVDHLSVGEVGYVRRLHPRYRPLDGIASFHHPVLGFISIDNLSLGGVLLLTKREHLDVLPLLNGEISGEIHILKSRISCFIVPVNGNDTCTGCRFKHYDQSLIMFLNRFFAPMRIGLAMKRTGGQKQHFTSQTHSLAFEEGGVIITAETPSLCYEATLTPTEFAIEFSSGSGDRSGVAEELLFILLGFGSAYPHINVSEFVETLLDRLGRQPQSQLLQAG
jgi:hypothetical protein